MVSARVIPLEKYWSPECTVLVVGSIGNRWGTLVAARIDPRGRYHVPPPGHDPSCGGNAA